VPLGGPVVYQATGVRDSATAATVVHCTNLGVASRTVFVDIYDFDGSFDCSVSTSIAPNETRTLATRPTNLYFEDATCNAAPATEQGSLDISLNSATALMCTVQVIDPAAATPGFVTTLDLFHP
jgi:hypothetical protein